MPSARAFLSVLDRLCRHFCRGSRFAFPAVILLGTTACRQYEVRLPEPIPIEEIVEMSRDGVEAEEILKSIWKSRTVYELTAADVIQLHEEGVEERVIDAMLETLRRALDSRWYYYDPYWYPPPPYIYYSRWRHW